MEHFLINKQGDLYQLEDYQKTMLRDDNLMKVFFLGRRMGKSIVMAFYMIWKALFNSNYSIMVVSPTMDQSRTLAETVTDMIYRSPAVLGELKHNRVYYEKFKNQSTIEFRTAGKDKTTSIVGSGVNLLLMDEAQDINDTLYNKIRPTIRGQDNAKSEIIFAGTPRGRAGFFYDAITHPKCVYNQDGIKEIKEANDEDYSVHIRPTAFMNEEDQIIKSGTRRITIGELEQDLRGMDIIQFKQEYCLEFLDDLGEVFSDALIDENMLEEEPPKEFRSKKLCVGGIDIGKTRNNTVLMIAEVTKDEQLENRYIKAFPLGTRYEEIVDYLINELPRRFPQLRRLVFDATGVGSVVAERLEKRVHYELEEFKFSYESKKALVENAVLALEEHQHKIIYDRVFRRELREYKREKTDTGRIVYVKGTSDDYVDAFMLLNYNLSLPLHFRPLPFIQDTGFKSNDKQFQGEQIWHHNKLRISSKNPRNRMNRQRRI